MTTQVRDYVADALDVLRTGRAEMAAQLARIDVAIAELQGSPVKTGGGNGEPAPPVKRRPGRPREKTTSPPAGGPEPRGKRVVSDETRRKMSLGQERRHAGGAAREQETPPADGEGTSDSDEPAPAESTPLIRAAEDFAALIERRGLGPTPAKKPRAVRLNDEEQRMLADYHRRQAQLDEEHSGAMNAEPPDPQRFEAKPRFRPNGEETPGPIQECLLAAEDNSPTLG